MTRWAVLVLAAAGLAAFGCGQTARVHSLNKVSETPPAIGDACMVGKWTLQEDVNRSNYTFNNQPVSVSGLRGATVTFSADGSESRDFDGSEPLVGNVGGRRLEIKVGGSVQLTIHASNGSFVENGAKTALPTSATLNGAPVQFSSYYEATSGTYQCSSSQLTMVSDSGNQSDAWSRG